MPDRGVLELSPDIKSPAGPHPEGASWTLTGRLTQVTFEVDRDAALRHLPPDVSRPIPCYGRIIVIEADESPVGAFAFGALFSGGRYRMFPRNVLVGGVVDGSAAEVARALGDPVRAGTVRASRSNGRIEVAIAGEEGDLAHLTLPALSAIDPAMLRWDPWLSFALSDGIVQLVESTLQPTPRKAFLSKGATVVTAASLPRAHSWRQLRDINPISACHVEGDMTLVLPQVRQALDC